MIEEIREETIRYVYKCDFCENIIGKGSYCDICNKHICENHSVRLPFADNGCDIECYCKECWNKGGDEYLNTINNLSDLYDQSCNDAFNNWFNKCKQA